MWPLYEAALDHAHLLRSSEIGKDVARLQLLSAEEVELPRHLIPAGASLADLLEMKGYVPVRNMGFKNFLFRAM